MAGLQGRTHVSAQRVLVIAAHPDDEVLGCGGTMAKHARNGDQVHVLIVGEGLTSRSASAPGADSGIGALRKTAERANAIMGVAQVSFLGLPDNRLDSLDRLEIIKPIEAHIADLRPQIVYTHHAGDVNVDHRRLHEAVVTACRSQPGHPVESLLFFEVASSTEWQTPGSGAPFTPQWFENISGTLDIKLAALGAYSGELRDWPHPRSLQAVTHLARWRGATCGVEAAEAFMLGRHIGRG